MRRWDLTAAAVAVLRNSRRAPTGAHSRGSTRRQAVRACGLAALAGCAATTRSCVRVPSAGICSSTPLAAAGASCVLLNCPRPSVVCVSVAKSGMAGNGLGALVEAVVPESVHDTLQSISRSWRSISITTHRVHAVACSVLTSSISHRARTQGQHIDIRGDRVCRDYEENGDDGRPVGFGHMFETHYLAPLRAGKAFTASRLYTHYMNG